jgi:hypothetical protein
MHLRPRLNSLEKKFFHDLAGVPNTGSSGNYLNLLNSNGLIPLTNMLKTFKIG